jgi:hypothetical protein
MIMLLVRCGGRVVSIETPIASLLAGSSAIQHHRIPSQRRSSLLGVAGRRGNPGRESISGREPGTQKRLYQFTAIDDCTHIRVLRVYDRCNQRTAIQFIDEVRRRLPFCIHVVQTDNGAEFHTSIGTLKTWTFGTSTVRVKPRRIRRGAHHGQYDWARRSGTPPRREGLLELLQTSVDT